ncbi:MAG: DNA adenine methylase [Armatimonadetes bacterium]|nr:DNA adenine methylase [Armatimonadota bacterium]
MRYVSPLRYPGGKASLSNFLMDTIDLNDLRECVYYEPYAGGAGAALTLLRDGVVSELFLNDADACVYAFWRAALNCTDRFVRKLVSIPLTVEEWKRQQAICIRPSRHTLFEVGFAAFYMNRCNRSGVLTGSGPIGGYSQEGEWRLDVRFNREALAERFLRLKRFRKRIHVSRKDAIVFLKSELPRGRGRDRVFVYLDPPYVNNGQRLYLNAYDADDHRALSNYLGTQQMLPWVMSYDDSELVRDLYKVYTVMALPIRYTLQAKRDEHELIIAPDNVAIPTFCRMGQSSNPLREIA